MKRILTLILTFFVANAIAQDVYFIGFTHKEGTPYSIEEPSEFLTQRAIERRAKQSIPIDSYDLPVNPNHVDAVKSSGGVVLYSLNWFNGVVAKIPSSTILNNIQSLEFVGEVKKIYNQYAKSSSMVFEEMTQMLAPKGRNNDDYFDYGYADQQIRMLNGHVLHNNGFRGEGMLIAVIDAGFKNADVITGFDHLWDEERIVFTYDVVNPNSNLYNEHYHGTVVLSTMGTYLPGQHVGTATKAHYALIRSENASFEQKIEEYNWVYAAQLADSIGADVINSSLGYYQFDDASQNYTYQDMDGQTTAVTQGANFVASRGVLVVNSVGNERFSYWEKLIAPSDSPDVIAVGAVDASGDLAYFSSEGPSADGRVKPDVMAMGYDAMVQHEDGYFGGISGTSFSSPILAGLATCLWQANPGKSAKQIHQLINESADRYDNPSNLYGYGLPDFSKISTGTEKVKSVPNLRIYPNPTGGRVNIILPETGSSTISLSVITIGGGEVYRAQINNPGNHFSIDALEHLTPGVYFIKLETPTNSYMNKVVKVN